MHLIGFAAVDLPLMQSATYCFFHSMFLYKQTKSSNTCDFYNFIATYQADAKNVEITADSSTKDLREKVQQLTRQLSDRQREMGELSDNHALHTKVSL